MKTAKPVPNAIPAAAELILASASAGRAALLRGAGLRFRQEPAAIDERALEAAALQRNGSLDAGALAALLAAEKARAVSRLHPGALVIGADQVTACEGQLLHKPSDTDTARKQLKQLRGRVHSVNAGVAVAVAGETRWRHVERAHLRMRDFSDEFLDAYIASEDPVLFTCVGAYRIEGLGIQLFSHIDGDHFSIIGLPLLPLLGYLREIGWLTS